MHNRPNHHPHINLARNLALTYTLALTLTLVRELGLRPPFQTGTLTQICAIALTLAKTIDLTVSPHSRHHPNMHTYPHPRTCTLALILSLTYTLTLTLALTCTYALTLALTLTCHTRLNP